MQSTVQDNPTPYTLSTITATGVIGCFIDLKTLYEQIVIDPLDVQPKRDGFTYIELGRKNENTICKGFHKKMFVNHKTKLEGKRFDNQASIILRKYEKSLDIYRYQSLKVFFNGSIQLTGLKSFEQGHWVLEYLLSKLKGYNLVNPRIYYDESKFGENALKAHNFQVRLINTDFKLNYCVNRRELDRVINNYGLYHVFEAGHYPGVKISFYWNSNKKEQNGICQCPGQTCMKRGKQKQMATRPISKLEGENDHSGNGEEVVKCAETKTKVDTIDTDTYTDTSGHCKKITVIVFQSGSVIITGAQQLLQVDDAYNHMNSIFLKEKDAIKKINLCSQLVKKYPKFSYDDLKAHKKIRLPQGYVFQE